MRPSLAVQTMDLACIEADDSSVLVEIARVRDGHEECRLARPREGGVVSLHVEVRAQLGLPCLDIVVPKDVGVQLDPLKLRGLRAEVVDCAGRAAHARAGEIKVRV